jgi:hypothetical protein
VAGTCDCGNELSGSIKCGNLLTSCKPISFSKNSAPWSKNPKSYKHVKYNLLQQNHPSTRNNKVQRNSTNIKYKLYHYRPGQALRLQEVEAPRISRQSADEGGKVVSPMHRQPLPLQEIALVLISVNG